MNLFDKNDQKLEQVQTGAVIDYYVPASQAAIAEVSESAVSCDIALAELRESDPDSYRQVMYGWA